VQINFITKSGSNNMTGYGRFYNTNDECFGFLGSCQAINVTDDLRKQNVGGGNPIQNIRDMGAQLGGPIQKNKAWFWGAMSRQDVRAGVLGFYDQTNSGCATLIATPNPASAVNADGSFKFGLQDIKDCLFGDLTTLKNYNGRLQFQEATGHQTEFSYTYGDKTRTSRGCDAFHPLISCSKQTGPSIFYTPSHRWIASNSLTVIAQYTHIHEDWFLGFEDPGLVDVQAINWVDTSYWDRSKSSASYHTIRPQDDGRADANYFKSGFLGADHSVKFGFAFRRSPVESLSTVGGGAVARYRGQYQFAPGAFITTLDTTAASFASGTVACTINGVSYAANTATGCNEADIQRDADFNYTLYQRNFYVQDSIKKGRATINVGLRFDHQHDLATPGVVGANRILPTQLPAINYPGADSGVRYNDWAPRVGLTYDLSGTGKSVLKLTYNKYYGLGVFTAQALEPTGSTTTLRFPWKDLNGDKTVQANELQIYKADGTTLALTNSPAGYDPANPGSVKTTAIVDPNMTNDVTNEFIIGLDHEVMSNFGVGVMYVYRKYDNFCGSAQQQCVGNAVRYLDSTDLYLSGGAQTFTAPCGNTLCGQSSYSGTFYNLSRPLNSNTIQENITEYRTYNGLELTARKRLTHHWMLTGSYVYNNEKVFLPTASVDYLDPTNHQPIELISGYEDGTRNVPHVFKLSGLIQLPYDVNAGINYNARSNAGFTPTLVTGTRANGAGTATIDLTPVNTQRLPSVQTLDLNFDKSIRFGGPRRATLNMSIFNVFNNNTVLGQTARQNTSTANYVTSIVGPRVIRFGIRLNF